MSISSQLILILSALGSLNGFILALYLWWQKERRLANRFLAAMLVMISVRTLKSVLFYFNPDIAREILQIGLSSCLLIGPLLYFFCLSHLDKIHTQSLAWKVQLTIILLVIIGVGSSYPYASYPELWGGIFYRTINFIWLGYLIMSAKELYPLAKSVFLNKKHSHKDIWLLAVFTGNLVIWFAYFTASYTSYIVGALSFTFVLLLAVLALIFRRSDTKAKVKYANHKIESEDAQRDIAKLHALMTEQQLFLDPMVSMPKVAKRMAMSTPRFSQLLNDNIHQSFSSFINQHRINHATELLKNEQNTTVEDIAMRCGFNSLSSFYSAFKKQTGLTPAKYKAEKSRLRIYKSIV